MNTKVLSVLVALTVLPSTTGCGSLCGWLHGRGAFCGSCRPNAPAYTVAPPAGGPLIGGHPGCGGPACGPVCPNPEPVCGTEFGGAYFGGYGAGYPINESVIGMPGLGHRMNDGFQYDQQIPSSGFQPHNQSYVVPGSQFEVEGTPLAPMQVTPRGTPLSGGA